MSFSLPRNANNTIIQTTKSNSTTPAIVNNSTSLGSVANAFNATINSLTLNNSLVTVNGAQLNYLNVTPGTAAATAALVLNSSLNINNINAISCSSVIINGGLLSTSGSSAPITAYLTTTPGTAVASTALVLDSNASISGINKLSTTQITLNGNILTTGINTNVNISAISNKVYSSTVNTTRAISAWSNSNGSVSNTWQSICWSPYLSIFVAVAKNSTNSQVMYSSDGSSWSSATAGATNTWNSVCWSQELLIFVVVSNASTGTGNGVMYSSNGSTWTMAVHPASSNNFASVCWSPDLNLFVAVSNSGTTNSVMISRGGFTWFSQTAASSNAWQSVCWSQHLYLFVAVSTTGTGNRVMTSPDGITWTSQTSSANNNWTSVCWSPELLQLVAVASSGTGNRVMTSSDGITWTSQTTPVDNNWSSVCWSSELSIYTAVASTGTNNSIMTSFNGTTWTVRTSPVNNAWSSICWSPDLSIFVSVASTGTTNQVMKSSIGLLTYSNTPNWTNKLNCNIATNCLAYGTTSNTYQLTINTISNVLVLKAPYLTGATTSGVTTGITSTGQINFVLNGYTGTSTVTVPVFNIVNHNGSTSGLSLGGVLVTASASQINTISNPNLTVATASKALILNTSALITGVNALSCTTLTIASSLLGTPGTAMASSGLVLDSSSNISNINSISYNSNILTLGSYSLTYLNRNKYYNPSLAKPTVSLSNLNNRINQQANYGALTSIKNWIQSPTAITGSFQSVCWSDELLLFVAVSNITNNIISSIDGITWTVRTSPVNNAWNSVCWSPEVYLFVAVASSGTGNRIMSSPDGITWTSRTNPVDNDWKSVCWSSTLNLFVSVASSGTGNRIMSSPDGITWTSQTNPVDNNWSSVCWSSFLNLFVAVSSTGTGNCVMTSPDGVTWTSRTSAANNAWSSVCYSPNLNLFVAVSSTGTGNCVMTSPDGITWTSRTSAANNAWTSVTWTPELQVFVAVASSGTSANQIMSSPNGITWATRANNSASASNFTNMTWSSICWSSQLGVFAGVTSLGSTVPSGVTSVLAGNWVQAYNMQGRSVPALQYTSLILGSTTGNYLSIIESPTTNNTIVSSIIQFPYNSIAGVQYTMNISNGSVTQIAASDQTMSPVVYNGNSYLVAVSYSSVNVNGLNVTLTYPVYGHNYGIILTKENYFAFYNNTWALCKSTDNGQSWFDSSGNNTELRDLVKSITGVNYNNNTTSQNFINGISLYFNTGTYITCRNMSLNSQAYSYQSTDLVTWTISTIPVYRTQFAYSPTLSIGVYCYTTDSKVFNYQIFNGGTGVINAGNTSTISKYNLYWLTFLNIFIFTTKDNTTGIWTARYSTDGSNWSTPASIPGGIIANFTGSNPFCLSDTAYGTYSLFTCYAPFASPAVVASNISYTMISKIGLASTKSAIMGAMSQINSNNNQLNLGFATYGSYSLSLSTDSAAKPSTSTWTISSDARLKDNIQDADLDICYNNVKNLRLARYTWKDDVYTSDQISDKRKLGWIADEVEQVFPKSVKQGEAHGYDDCRSLNADQIMMSMYGALQKLMIKTDAKQDIIKALIAKIVKMEAFVKQIQA